MRKCWGCLGVRGGFWVEGGWRGSKGGGCESSANKLADRLWISIYTAFAGCDVAGKDRGPLPDGISIHTAFAGCDSTTTTLRSVFVISIHTAFAGCDSKSHQFFLTNLDTLISYSTHSLQQINPSSHFLLFFRRFLLLISVRMSWGFYVRLGFARWYAFGVAFFVSRRFPELLFVSSSSSGFGSIFENAGC